MSIPSTLLQTPDTDPGDDTQRRFRYQHAFGAVLLIASIKNENDYVSIWCEHHEDFLAESSNGTFDAFQVKTRDTGETWQVSDESFYKSISRFVNLESLSAGAVRNFAFTTNAKPFHSTDEKKKHLCPLPLIEGVKAAQDHASLNGTNTKALKLLAKKTKISEATLFGVLKKTTFVLSMPLDGFEALVAHEHLAKYDPCEYFAAAVLSRIVERLISLIFSASSLAISDPARHYAPLTNGTTLPETLLAKRVTPQAVALAVNEIASPAFRYLDGLSSLQPASPESWSILKRKMERGGIGSFFDLLYRRAISAEANLLGLDPNSEVVNQIENLVADQCDEIRLKLNATADPCGDKMLLEVISRFETLARDQPARVHKQQPEMLVGVAGLLAGDCKVWWSKPFDLQEPAV